MQRDARSLPLGFLAVALCALMPSVLLTACGSTPESRFYVLTATEQPVAGDTATMKVGLDPVILPSSVDRPQFLMSVSPNERSLWEFARWAGSLPENMGQVIGQNLEAHLGPSSVFSLPSRHAPPVDFMVTVEVLQLDADPDGNLSMITRFHVSDSQGEWLTTRNVAFDHENTEDTEGAAAVAEAMSAGLGELSGSIAEALRDQPAPTADSGD